jgi:hypothetical protein
MHISIEFLILLFDERKFNKVNFHILIIYYKIACLKSECCLMFTYADVFISTDPLTMTSSVAFVFAVSFAHLLTVAIWMARNNIDMDSPFVCRHG